MPDTVSEVSLVMKSLDDVPVSSAIAVMSTVAVGAAVSMVTAWLSSGAGIARRVDHPRL